jgi:hypothetical protein
MELEIRCQFTILTRKDALTPDYCTLGRRADAVLGRASATTEDSLRQTASDPSGVPLFAVGEDLLQDPPEGFLKQFLSRLHQAFTCMSPRLLPLTHGRY